MANLELRRLRPREGLEIKHGLKQALPDDPQLAAFIQEIRLGRRQVRRFLQETNHGLGVTLETRVGLGRVLLIRHGLVRQIKLGLRRWEIRLMYEVDSHLDYRMDGLILT